MGQHASLSSLNPKNWLRFKGVSELSVIFSVVARRAIGHSGLDGAAAYLAKSRRWHALSSS